MATWTDRQRGARQGRVEPVGITPPEGDYTFVLGSIDDTESALLTAGDYSEVRQTVDLTDYDLVSVTMDTIGTLMNTFQAPSGWLDDDDTVFLYNFNSNQKGAFPRHDPGFPLVGAGGIEVATETYSPDGAACREIPVGSSGCSENATLDTQIFPATGLRRYIWEMWLNFDCASVPFSWGIDPILFSCQDPAGSGLQVHLSGATGPGAHTWYFYVTMHNLAHGSSGVGFAGYSFDAPSPGWKLFQIGFDFTQPTAQRLTLWIDGVFVGYPFSGPTIYMDGPPAVGSPFQIADPYLWGQFSQQRLRALTPSAPLMLASYNECINTPPLVEFVWKMQILIDDVLYAERTIEAGERRQWSDMIVPVRRLINDHEVSFRLSYEEA